MISIDTQGGMLCYSPLAGDGASLSAVEAEAEAVAGAIAVAESSAEAESVTAETDTSVEAESVTAETDTSVEAESVTAETDTSVEAESSAETKTTSVAETSAKTKTTSIAETMSVAETAVAIAIVSEVIAVVRSVGVDVDGGVAGSVSSGGASADGAAVLVGWSSVAPLGLSLVGDGDHSDGSSNNGGLEHFDFKFNKSKSKISFKCSN